MNIKSVVIVVVIAFQSAYAFCQNPPAEFFKGLELLNTNKKDAKREFLIAVERDSLFHGSYHFLGTIMVDERKPDSAILYFAKAIRLNKDNARHTQEMAYVRLLNTYCYQRDFKNAFAAAWEAYKLYPENKGIPTGLKDICLWSFHIKHNQLDPSYLSPDIQKEYIVNSIPQEYLIFRKIVVNGEYLLLDGQSLVSKNEASYDVFRCTVSVSKEKVELNFKLNWNMNKDFGGKPAPTAEVYANANNPVYERIGALLVKDPKTDLKTEIEKLLVP